MKTVIVAVDFSDTTERIGEMLSDVHLRADTRVLLVHVLEYGPMFAQGQIPKKVLRDLQSQKLEMLRGRLAESGINAEALVTDGKSPDKRILEISETNQPAIIVVGSHGHGATFSLLLGNVTDSLLRSANCPLVIVPGAKAGTTAARDKANGGVRNIILASVDFSDLAEKVVDATVEVSSAFEAGIVLMHVIERDSTSQGEMIYCGLPAYSCQGEQAPECEAKLNELKARCGAVQGLRTLLCEADSVVKQVIEECARIRPVMVALGSHSHGCLYNLALCTVTASILKWRSIPVLVVPARGVLTHSGNSGELPLERAGMH